MMKCQILCSVALCLLALVQNSESQASLPPFNEAQAATNFHVSDEYKCHRYLLSNADYHDAVMAETVCELEGGYLAEINDADELQFVRDYLFKYNLPKGPLISGNFDPSLGQWFYTYSQQKITFFDWHSGEPGSGGCIGLYSTGLQMFDFSCLQMYPGYNYLCEVEVCAD